MILSEDDKEYLKSLYYDLEFPASLSGPKKFYQEIKKRNDRPISRAQVDEFLRGEHVYTTNRNIQRKCTRNVVGKLVPVNDTLPHGLKGDSLTFHQR